MSQEEPITRKDKKALRDAERRNKGKKRKHADTEEAETQPGQPAIAKDVDQQATESTKKSKKRKSADVENEDKPVSGQEVAPSEATKRPKKKRKKTTTESTSNTENGEQQKPTKSRFILFIGNLSFKTTDETLRAHFKKLEPFTLRHLTDPKTKKSKGCAFIEFENYDRLKTCIKLYHHSIFDPTKKDIGGDPVVAEEGESSKKRLGKDARRINVELTAGGGGKTDARNRKIKAKNVRLEEQRKRRAELERKERAKKDKEGGGKVREKKSAGKDVQQQADVAGAGAGADADASHGIHPSRLARING